MKCPRCQEPLSPTEPTATMTYHGLEYDGLCVRCAYVLRSRLRHLINHNVSCNNRMAKDVRSLRIVPAAVDDAARCVECGGSATPEDPDAAVCRWCGGVFWDTAPADEDGLLIDADGMVTGGWAH